MTMFEKIKAQVALVLLVLSTSCSYLKSDTVGETLRGAALAGCISRVESRPEVVSKAKDFDVQPHDVALIICGEAANIAEESAKKLKIPTGK